MPIRISAKDLGQLAMPSFCPYCFWFEMAVGRQLPFQTFPGIFSSFDSLNKRSVHDHFDKYGPPTFFKKIPPVSGYEMPKRMTVYDPESGVTLTGEPDGICLLADKSGVVINDYKTARLTDGQDALMPLYTVQLNAYAYQRRVQGLSPAKHLFLVYMDPLTNRSDIEPADYIRKHPKGYQLDFDAQVVPVELKDDSYIPSLLAKVAEISALKRPPEGLDGCGNCRKLNALLALADAGLPNDRGMYADMIFLATSAGIPLADAVRHVRARSMTHLM